jgi:hypothetical protein
MYLLASNMGGFVRQRAIPQLAEASANIELVGISLMLTNSLKN